MTGPHPSPDSEPAEPTRPADRAAADSTRHARRRTLVERARNGSQDARGELFDSMQPALERYLRNKVGARLGRAVSVSDIAQESFVHAFDQMGRLRDAAEVSDFKGLLFQHAHWLLHKAARRHQDFTGESVVGSPLPAAVPSGAASTRGGEVTRRDENHWLGRQIDRLSESDSEVLRMRSQGLEFEEIAQSLGIQVEAARKRCLRAAQRLRSLIEGA